MVTHNSQIYTTPGTDFYAIVGVRADGAVGLAITTNKYTLAISKKPTSAFIVFYMRQKLPFRFTLLVVGDCFAANPLHQHQQRQSVGYGLGEENQQGRKSRLLFCQPA